MKCIPVCLTPIEPHTMTTLLSSNQNCVSFCWPVLVWFLLLANYRGISGVIGGSLRELHYGDVIMSVIASLITSLTIVYLSVYSGAGQGKHQSSASLAFVRGIHRRPVNSPHKGPVTRKMFPFDDVIMNTASSIHTPW